VHYRCELVGSCVSQYQRINLLKGEIAVPELVVLVPDAGVAQAEVVDCKLQMRSVQRDSIENGFIAARVDKLAAEPGTGFFNVDSHFETAFISPIQSPVTSWRELLSSWPTSKVRFERETCSQYPFQFITKSASRTAIASTWYQVINSVLRL